MSSNDVAQTIEKFVIDNFLFGSDSEHLAHDASFFEGGLIDSTGILEVVQFVEETYDVEIADDEMTAENLDSVEKLTTFIARKKGAEKDAPVEC